MAGYRRAVFLAAVVSSIVVSSISAQTLSVGDPVEDYLRLLQISGLVDSVGSFTVRPLAPGRTDAVRADTAHPWEVRWAVLFPPGRADPGVHLTPPRLAAFASSRFPVGRNDGAVWQGRGLTTALDLGATFRWRGLHVELEPTLMFNQNADQDLAPVSDASMPVYAYPWRKIDWPQQFGPDAFWTLDPGQSEVRLASRGLSVGVSTKNLWWGPGIRNAIVMSNNAPGFPHAFVGTDGPASVGIGGIEGRWLWGRLQQSDWFDPLVPDERFITGLILSYSPSFVPGLSLGLARLFYVLVPDDGVPLGDYFAVLRGVRTRTMISPTNPTGEDEHDQLISTFGRWVLAESGFEVYWEWVRNDFAFEVRDFLLEPEHSEAYSLGLQKAWRARGDRLLNLGFELTHLEADATFQVRDKGTYYVHHLATQGYTQRGQIIGAGIGPGGNAQSLALSLYAPWGRVGAWVERQVHNNDAYYAWEAANGGGYCCHDVSLHFGTHALWFTGDWELGGGMIATREMNRWFYGLDYWNLNLSFSARWHPPA